MQDLGDKPQSRFAMTFALVTDRQNLALYVDQVRFAADQEREAFGFIPAAAYDDFAFQERLIVAVEESSSELVGYTIVGGATPQGRIFQTWTKSSFRGRGIGHKLIGEVIRRFEVWGYLSVRAEVAADLPDANQFYGSLGFDIVRVKTGGEARRRQINVRVRELATPSLLDVSSAESQGLGKLELGPSTSPRSPLYLIDVNVLLDAGKKRDRAPFVQQLISAAFDNEVRLAVSSEFVSELEAQTDKRADDPMLELARALPRLLAPRGERLHRWLAELGTVVFPSRAANTQLRRRDLSDLTHLATAVEECAAGFITSEKAILRAAPYFRSTHQLDILSPEAFGPEEPQAARSISLGGKFQFTEREVDDTNRGDAERFLGAQHLSARQTQLCLSAGSISRPRRRRVFCMDGRVVGYAGWGRAGSGTPTTLSAFLDEGCEAASAVAEHLLLSVVGDLKANATTVIDFQPHIGQSTLRRAAIGIGFFGLGGNSPRTQPLRKVAIKATATDDNWHLVIRDVLDSAGLRFPASIPVYSDPEQSIELVDRLGNSMQLSLREVERHFSPVLFALPQRPAVVLPIKASYAEELFRGSAQPNFLSNREAILHFTRAYIGSASSYGVISEGSLVIFYESARKGGRGAATAVARVLQRYLMDKTVAPSYAARRGVLDASTIHGMGRTAQVTVTELSEPMIFERPVTLEELRNIGCVDGTNFVTARSISSDHLRIILSLGMSGA